MLLPQGPTAFWKPEGYATGSIPFKSPISRLRQMRFEAEPYRLKTIIFSAVISCAV
jgi:hypothetical protein